MNVYLNCAVTGTVAGYHATTAAAFVGRVDAGAGSLGSAAGFLDTALDVIGVVWAIGCEVEAGGDAVAGRLAGT